MYALQTRETLMFYSLLADVVVGVHVLYVGFVVLGELAIWLGLVCGWKWARNPWFRWIHLILMAIVGTEAVLNITCPLTRWEAQLRALGGQETDGTSFMGRLLHDLIFIDAPEWFLTSLHITFTLVVLLTFVLAPPRRRPKPAPA